MIKCRFHKGDIPWHKVLKSIQAKLYNERWKSHPRWCFGICLEVCDTLEYINHRQSDRMCEWISAHLDGWYSAERWLVEQGVRNDTITKQKMQQWRIEWLELLIEESQRQWRKYAKETR